MRTTNAPRSPMFPSTHYGVDADRSSPSPIICPSHQPPPPYTRCEVPDRDRARPSARRELPTTVRGSSSEDSDRLSLSRFSQLEQQLGTDSQMDLHTPRPAQTSPTIYRPVARDPRSRHARQSSRHRDAAPPRPASHPIPVPPSKPQPPAAKQRQRTMRGNRP